MLCFVKSNPPHLLLPGQICRLQHERVYSWPWARDAKAFFGLGQDAVKHASRQVPYRRMGDSVTGRKDELRPE